MTFLANPLGLGGARAARRLMAPSPAMGGKPGTPPVGVKPIIRQPFAGGSTGNSAGSTTGMPGPSVDDVRQSLTGMMPLRGPDTGEERGPGLDAGGGLNRSMMAPGTGTMRGQAVAPMGGDIRQTLQGMMPMRGPDTGVERVGPGGAWLNRSMAAPGPGTMPVNRAPGGGLEGMAITPINATPGRNLRGTAILPGQSANERTGNTWMMNAGQGLADVQFSPFQGVDVPTFGEERGMLGGANTAMQGLSYDFGGANAQYGNAQSMLAGAAGQAGGILNRLAGMGPGAFGGGTAQANTARLNADMDAAAGYVGPAFAQAGDVGNARSMTMRALEQAMTGPERSELAKQAFDLMAERSQGDFDRSLRTVGQRAAALGRIGSGMTTNNLTELSVQRGRDLDRTQRELALEAAQQTLADRVARTQLGLGVTQGLGGEDRENVATRLNQGNLMRQIGNDRFQGEALNAQLADRGLERGQRGAIAFADLQRGVAQDLFGMGRDQSRLALDVGDRFGDQARDRVGLGERQADFTRGTARDLADLTDRTFRGRQTERDAARRDQFDVFGAQRDRFRDFGDFLDRERRYTRGLRDETRDERDYQDGLARDAMENERQRMLFEELLRNGRFTRAQGLAGLGYDGNPGGALMNAGAQQGMQAGDYFSVIGDLLSGWMANRGGGRRSGAGRGGAPDLTGMM